MSSTSEPSNFNKNFPSLYKALQAAGVDIISGDYEGKKRKDRRTLAILAPTNKAASVLRMRAVLQPMYAKPMRSKTA